MKGVNAMGKWLVLWELDESKVPVDPKQRGSGWQMLMALVKQDLEEGTGKDWGAFVGEHRGYTIHEGTQLEIAVALQQYVPFVRFRVHPVETVSQVEQLIEALLQ
jgi:hypothetical protein